MAMKVDPVIRTRFSVESHNILRQSLFSRNIAYFIVSAVSETSLSAKGVLRTVTTTTKAFFGSMEASQTELPPVPSASWWSQAISSLNFGIRYLRENTFSLLILLVIIFYIKQKGRWTEFDVKATFSVSSFSNGIIMSVLSYRYSGIWSVIKESISRHHSFLRF